ncbi:allatostatin-A receptor-like [Lingula anatina]|uniref:Allatostatin-A receptor-like n=1 Tax=Lingula anatina TaxID=7574 RepID=A0A1S3HYP6_LINAN|nr:allatostatin-A receptor-like [Lingula anatina]|eukprot:XP_013391145.1 allatostatin-A receptor-like [Lingula anatina]
MNTLSLDENITSWTLSDSTNRSEEDWARIQSYYNLINTFSTVCPAIFGSILLLGILGNGMVIYAILANKFLRTCPNMLFLNLAVADLLFLLFCVPLQAAYYISKYDLILGEGLCKLFKYTIFVTMSVSAYSLMIICVFRCIAVAMPLQASRILTKRYSLIASGLIWLAMLLLNSPIALYYSEASGSCTSKYDDKDTIVAIAVGVDFLLPITACFVGTGIITVSLRRNQKVFKKMDYETLEKLESCRRSTRKVVILVVSVAVVFFVCWAPFLSITLYNALPIGDRVDPLTVYVAGVIAQLLAFSNSCANPIIYNFVSTDFRRGFRRIKQCRLRRGLQRQSTNNTTRSDIVLRERNVSLKLVQSDVK